MKKLRWNGWLLIALWGALGAAAVWGEDVTIAPYAPESGTFKASLGALTNDIDNFMSVNAFRNVTIRDSFGYVGIDPRGFNLGYARNIGSLYLGVCYGGSLIDDLYRRITNQESQSILKRDTEITDANDKQDTTHGIVNTDGEAVPGTAISKNDISVLLGFGNYGLKLGFSQYLQGRYDPLYEKTKEYIVYNPIDPTTPLISVDGRYPLPLRNIRIDQEFISSMRPSFEFGGKITAGSILVKPALRAGLDFHQYSSTKTGSSSIFAAPTSEEEKSTKLTYIIDTEDNYLGDFIEPALGLSLGFDFSQDPRIHSELLIDYDLNFRLYSNNTLPATVGKIVTTVIDTAGAAQEQIVDTETEIWDMRMKVVPAFKFSADMGTRFTAGVNLGINMAFNTYNTTKKVTTTTGGDTTDPEENTNNMSQFIVAPKLGLGLSFKLIPDHFSINLGVGINVLTYEETTTIGDDATTDTITENDTTTVHRTLMLPSTNLGVGLTFHFNESFAADVLVVTSGIGAQVSDPAQFNLLLTMKY
ncbi:MAG: hypothetical protein LBQ30_01915 [Treponema sp.]|nr:hypothetical protein [Treponema sp.]